jgi:endonuclease YncB( thermonuclease family)
MKRLAVAAVTALMVMIPTSAHAARADYVVDGDTIRLSSGVYVRLIGIDTPEVGECGYRAAKRKLNQWVGGNVRLVNPAGVDDRDGYGRLLRYVHDSGRDTGLGLIRRGLADARYDGRDGYDRHPRQAKYRQADRNNPDRCR